MNLSIGANMPAESDTAENEMQRRGARAARPKSISTRLTADEERQILAAAEAQGKPPTEWARDQLLRGAMLTNRGEMEMHIFTELVGIQMLLMNALDPLLRGEKMTQEELTALFRQVQTTKAGQAQQLLVKRSQNKER
jgi:hypothetical protein